MPRRAVPALLALTAFSCDLGGAHRFALTVLFLAIPACFALLVTCYADAAGPPTVLAAVGLVLLVVSAALRSPALVGGVPRVAISALALALFPCSCAALRVRPARLVAPSQEDEPDTLREAA